MSYAHRPEYEYGLAHVTNIVEPRLGFQQQCVSYRGERSGSEEEFARGREGIRSEDRLLHERVVVFVHTCRSSAPSFLLSKEPGNATRTQAQAHSHHYSGRIHSRPDTRMFGSLGRDERRGPVGSESVSGTVVTRPTL